MSDHSPERETVNRESHPNAGGPEGLAGDMGISSEREGPFEGIEGMGSQVSTQGATEGESPTFDDTDQQETLDDPTPGSAADSVDLDKPDQTSPATGVDRTVGEVQPDPVRDEDKQTFDPSRNPGH
jgi:hypothetical protein